MSSIAASVSAAAAAAAAATAATGGTAATVTTPTGAGNSKTEITMSTPIPVRDAPLLPKFTSPSDAIVSPISKRLMATRSRKARKDRELELKALAQAVKERLERVAPTAVDKENAVTPVRKDAGKSGSTEAGGSSAKKTPTPKSQPQALAPVVLRF